MEFKFWMFMLLMLLLIPLTMIIIGKRAKSYHASDKFDMSKYRKKFNIKNEKEWIYLSGYRTARSMKNDETFKFAQKLFGEWWYRVGLMIFLPTLIAMGFLVDKSRNEIGIWGLIIVVLQCVAMIIPYIPIERALKENFDKDGNKIGKLYGVCFVQLVF